MARAADDLVGIFLALREQGLRPGLGRRVEIDEWIVEQVILDQGNRPAFKGYDGFPRQLVHLDQRRGRPR